ncbi:MAG: DUF1465 family protein [Hyphomicrobium sp.]
MSKSKVQDKKNGSLRKSFDNVAISFGEKFQSSIQFDKVFQEGMSLVERAASYLDGDGRREAKSLDGHLTVLYTTESMRLTTRLLDLASWLLIRRALKEGEITKTEAQKKRDRLKLENIGRPSHVREFDKLPQGLQELIEQSFSLHDRIVQLDLAMTISFNNSVDRQEAYNPVGKQLDRLEKAFTDKLN